MSLSTSRRAYRTKQKANRLRLARDQSALSAIEIRGVYFLEHLPWPCDRIGHEFLAKIDNNLPRAERKKKRRRASAEEVHESLHVIQEHAVVRAREVDVVTVACERGPDDGTGPPAGIVGGLHVSRRVLDARIVVLRAAVLAVAIWASISLAVSAHPAEPSNRTMNELSSP